MTASQALPNGSLQDVETPVLIVGAGPSGATTALLLARHGIPCISISRHVGTANTPRAHIFNQRAMEILRDAGLEDVLDKVASPAVDMMHTSWLHSLNGEEYGRLWAWGNRPSRLSEYEAASPCKMSDLPQSILEPILVEAATTAGAEFRFHTEFVSQTEHEDGRIVTVVRHRPSETTYNITSKYLIGADGARSPVLESLGIPIVGKQLNNAFNVHIKADLQQYLKHRPGSLNWILNPEAPQWSAVGNFRMVRPWTEWVVSMHPLTKDNTQPFEPSEEDILKRLHQMIGDNSVPIDILSSFRWTINDQVAETWQKGNVICIGDAVHRHPPINGLGSNTCISDAMNLAWKLAYVLKGIASPRILDTVTTERKPVGDGVVRRANEGMEAHRSMWEIIGLSKEKRSEAVFLLKQDTNEGKDLRKRFNIALEKIDDELNALGIQMNQTYVGSPLTLVEPGDQAPDFSGVNRLKQQLVSTYPGYHVPHVWIAKDGQSYRKSILDVCGNGEYTLLIGIGGEAWRRAAETLKSAAPHIPLRVVSIGWHQDYMDAYREWEGVRGVDEDGAVLVRPDHFVAWRSKHLVESPEEHLKTVFQRILPNA